MMWLLACGVQGEPLQPSPPPPPPEVFNRKEEAQPEVVGAVADVSASTRSWTVVGDGKRIYCVLAADGRILVSGADAAVEQLLGGMEMKLEGEMRGDVMIVERATVGTVPAPPVEAPPVDPAALAPDAAAGTAAPAAEPPAEAPATPAPAPPATP